MGERFRIGSLRLLVTAVAALGVVGPLAAQRPGSVRGVVSDDATGRVVEGFDVGLPGLRLWAMTDAEGRFAIAGVPPGVHALHVEVLGCPFLEHRVEIRPGETTVADMSIPARVFRIQSLEVTGPSIELPDRDLPFAVDRLELDDRDRAAGRTLAALIQGRLAGAEVVQGSGQPGAEPSIQLRGATSIQGSQEPLIIIDGVVTRGSLAHIDPMDVARVDVLKGAAAAALYGSRAQAGVVEVTTRRGAGTLARAQGPLLVIDGRVTARTLAEIDPADIQNMRFVKGSTSALLLGPRGEAGVIEIVTRNGAGPGRGGGLVDCLSP